MPVKHSILLNRSGIALLCFLLLSMAASVVNAEEDTEQKKRQQLMAEMVEKGAQGTDDNLLSTIDDPARPRPLPESSSTPLTSQLYEKALQDYYSYRSEGLQHRRAVFIWQLFSAKLIFTIVLLLVGSGVIFAAIQFRQGMKSRDGSSGDKDNLSTEMELSTSGFKITSPVLGVIILTLSLGFFYLYLVYVYPIENIF